MKAKVIRGAGFRGALNYVFGVGKKEKKAEVVAGNMSGRNPRELSTEFGAVRALRADIEKPVWHCSLALPYGENLSQISWESISARFIEELGFNEANQWIAVRHGDTEHDHIHIICNRVGLDGSVWLGKWEARKAIEATQVLEKEFGLTLTAGLKERPELKFPAHSEFNLVARTGAESTRMKLQSTISDVLSEGSMSAPQMMLRLAARGVKTRPNVATTGTLNGFSFEIDGLAFSGSKLGKKFAWSGLQKSGVSYDQANDFDDLKRLSALSLNDLCRELQIELQIESHFAEQARIDVEYLQYEIESEARIEKLLQEQQREAEVEQENQQKKSSNDDDYSPSF